MPVAQKDVQFVDHFNTNANSQTNPNRGNDTFANWYTIMGEGTWNGNNTDNQLKADIGMGGKAVIKDTESSDVIVEADINVAGQAAAGANGNLGVVIRGTDFTTGVDGANGYYAGIGVQGNNADNNNGVAAGQGFIEVGRMHQGWTALKKVAVPEIVHGETYRLRVVMVGSRLRVYLNDNPVPYVDVYDATYTGGQVALRGFRANGTYDNVVVSTAPRYEADFENGSMNEWTAYMGNWSVADGAMKGQGAGMALVGNHGWSDYEYTGTVTPEAGAIAGLAVRAMAANSKVSGYFVALDEANDKLQGIKAERGETSVLAEKAMAVNAG